MCRCCFEKDIFKPVFLLKLVRCSVSLLLFQVKMPPSPQWQTIVTLTLVLVLAAQATQIQWECKTRASRCKIRPRSSHDSSDMFSQLNYLVLYVVNQLTNRTYILRHVLEKMEKCILNNLFS